MAQQDPTGPIDHDADSVPSQRSRGWWTVLVPAVALLIGLGLGGLVVSVAGRSDTQAPPTPTPSPAQPAPSDVTVVVPHECLDAVDTAEQATQRIREGVSAIRDFKPDQVVTLLNDLEDLDTLAREQAKVCQQTDVSRTQ